MDDIARFAHFKLAHSMPDHVHATSRMKFIGPIPKGWLTTHKKKWLTFRTNYGRKDASFSAEDATGLPNNLESNARWKAEALLLSSTISSTGRTREEELTQNDNVRDGRDVATNGNEQEVLPENKDQLMENVERKKGTTTPKPGPSIQFKDDEALVHLNPRPPINITSPESHVSTRESSSFSMASFATAPETQEEQAALTRRLDEEEACDPEEDDDSEQHSDALSDDHSDDQSDASTVRATVFRKESELETEGTSPVSPEHFCAGPSSSPGINYGLVHNEHNTSDNPTPSSSDANSRKSLLHHKMTDDVSNDPPRNSLRKRPSNLVRFDDRDICRFDRDAVEDTPVSAEGAMLDSKARSNADRKNQGYLNHRFLKNPFRKPKQVGELLRAERMLVQVEFARGGAVPADYSEIKSAQIERRTKLHWREFIVAARNAQNGNVVLRLHRNRTVPAIAKEFPNTRATEKIELKPGVTNINLFSSLDKTIVIWEKNKKGTLICILRPRTTRSSIEWYAFLQTNLNIKPNSSTLISVPLLNLKLRIDLHNRSELVEPPNGSNPSLSCSSVNERDASAGISMDVNEEGQVVASGVAITGEYLIDTCWRMLSQEQSWHNVLTDWKRNERMGLCWRRYDRLEWIHGHNAEKLVGQWSMQASHELEFRPKEHYATEVKLSSGEKLQEPSPVEGFLVRLTSSTGRQARFGKVFYKRLYFSTHDGLLFYSRPAKATPPPPPDFGLNLQDVEQVLEASPLIWNVDPFPLENGKIPWLDEKTPQEETASRNEVAITESCRRTDQLQASDGYVDLAEVIKIRRCEVMPDDVKNNVGHHGDGVPFHVAGQEDAEILAVETGAVDAFDDDRAFELVLESGLVIRLQAYCKETRQAWMESLAQLVKYWRLKLKADARELRKMRQANLQALQIDEEVEAMVGQYSTKWEVTQCVSEPQIYNFCPISSCRTISHRGLLYYKPRVHSTFTKYQCVISHGQLLIYNNLHWDATGTVRPHIHHSKRQVVDLKECYIYSGSLTENELIGARETSDREGPGRRTLPRLHEDGWTSQDEQLSLCFVLWTGRRRKAFSGIDKRDSNGNNSVSRLGVAGYSSVYMARCRQERDLWVQIISNEIERALAT